jgi:peptidyl-prolyl cis-trans isomerase D
MAIIGKIRKHSGLAVIIVGVAIAAFVIGDFGKKRYRGTTDIGTVDGKSIPYTDFNNEVDQTIDIQKENNGNEKITDEETYNIRQQTWNTMVKNIIMEKECDALGLIVSPEELFDQVQGKNPHRYILQYFKDPKTGVYDPSLVLNYLKNLDNMEPKAKTQWLRFEKAIKEDRLQTKFDNLVAKAYYMPRAFLKKDYIDQSLALRVHWVAPTIEMIPDSTIKLTDADYQDFYNKNKPYFYQDQETRDLNYVVFNVVPSDADKKKIAEDVSSIYKEFTTIPDVANFVNANSDKKYDSTFTKKGTLPGRIDSLAFISPVGTYFEPFISNNAWYMGKLLAVQERPDTIRGAQLLVSYAGTALSQSNKNITRTKEQAEKKADSLLQVLKKDPSSFKMVTMQESDFPSAKEDGGDLKDIKDGDPSFAVFFNAGLDMKPNEIKIIHTNIGYAIFKVTFKSKPVKKVQVALLERNIDPSNQTYQDTYIKASMFAGQNRTANAFEKSAEQQGLSIRDAMSVKDMDNAVMGLQQAREVVRWAYADATKTGEVSPVFDLQGKYVVAVLQNINEKGYTPLDKIKDRLEQGVKNLKKVDVWAERLTNAMKTTKDLASLGAMFTTKIDSTNLTFAGYNPTPLAREYDLVGQLFTSKQNTLLGPLKGRYAAYVVIIEGTIPPAQTEDYAALASQLTAGFANRVSNGLYDAIRKASDIKDNRRMFY